MVPKMRDRDLWQRGTRHRGMQMFCPECFGGGDLRQETPDDFALIKDLMPEAVKQPEGLNRMVVRCDKCGLRIEMTGSRLVPVSALQEEQKRRREATKVQKDVEPPPCGA
jgi:hypothetical protein